MSVNVRDQIRIHYRGVDDAQTQVEWLEIVERLEPGKSKPKVERRPWAIAAAGAVFTLILVGSVPFLSNIGGTDLAGTDLATSIPEGDAVLVRGTESFVVETEILGSLRWTRFETFDKDTPVTVDVDPNGGYIAHTWSEHVWHSAEGTVWRVLSQTESDAALARTDTEYVQAETATLPVGTETFFVTKGNFGYISTGGESVTSTWLSIDGEQWELLQVPPPLDETVYGFVGGGSHGAAGDLIYFAEAAANGNVLWIGRFESGTPTTALDGPSSTLKMEWTLATGDLPLGGFRGRIVSNGFPEPLT